MSGDMPERIWAIADMDDVPRRHTDCGCWRDDREDAVAIFDTDQHIAEYIRLDAHESALAALRAQVWGEVCDKLMVICQTEIDRGDRNNQAAYASGARACRDKISVLTPTQEARHG